MKKMFIYGDSNTYGYDPADRENGRYAADVRWVDRMADELAGEWEISADGMNGRCIPEREFDRELLLKKIRARLPLDLVVIMLGTNDYVNMRFPDPEEVAQKMASLITWLKSRLPDIRILILSPPKADFRGIREMKIYSFADGRLSEALKRAAERCGVDFINTDAWDLPMAYDRGHLAADGHRKLARCFKEHLTQI